MGFPEPLFTKAFVTALTLRLALAVGAWELSQFARACVRLYQEAQAARTVEELEAVAERFGKAAGLIQSPTGKVIPPGPTAEV